MDIKAVLKPLMPVITVAAGLGGPFGVAAAQALQAKLNEGQPPDKQLTITPTLDGIHQALSASTDPDVLLKAQQADQDFQAKMQGLSINLAQIDAGDRDSARNREAQVRDKTPMILAIGICVMALAITTLICVAFMSGKPTVRDVAIAGLMGTIVGYVFSELKQVFSYYFGSSAGSDRKTELLAEAPPIPSVKN